MNTLACHGEERSDVAIHLKYLLDCRARRPGLAMTNWASSLTGAALGAATKQSSPRLARGREQVDRHGALSAPRDDRAYFLARAVC